jgi:acetylornithine/N-succinyldiaminopimelate aminotransferase
MPNYRFVPFNDIKAVEEQLDKEVAAIILEPVQGEGGIRIPDEDYFQKVSTLCKANGSLLIMDEVQTGFCRTGPFFATGPLNIEVDFLTMAKGIAGGFPFGAFAVSEDISNKFNIGDHGGTYSGNPLGCAVASAVIEYLEKNNIQSNVETIGAYLKGCLELCKEKYADIIKDIRGKGLLIAVELFDDKTALKINKLCLKNNLLINVTQGNIIRIFPALTITKEEVDKGLESFEKSIMQIGQPI